MKRWFVEHPASVGESYATHMGTAFFFARHMAVGTAACLVHAVFPGLCQRTASKRIAMLHDRMIAHRRAEPRT